MQTLLLLLLLLLQRRGREKKRGIASSLQIRGLKGQLRGLLYKKARVESELRVDDNQVSRCLE